MNQAMITTSEKKSSVQPGCHLSHIKCNKSRLAHSRAPQTAPPIVPEAMRSPGQPLDQAAQIFIRPRLSYDFSRIPMLSRSQAAIQAKLAVNAPGDIYEQEADRVADQVLAMPGHIAVSSAPPCIQHFTEQSSGQVEAVPASVDYALAGPGRPLEPELQMDMEGRFGHDFSRVRVHADGYSERSARDVNARAYTVGNNIVFGPGWYSPGSFEGKRLIAHELTHVVQQGGAKSPLPGQPLARDTSGYKIMRSIALDSTVRVCRRQLESRKIKVSKGGLRVVLLLRQLDTQSHGCRDHEFWLTLTQSVENWFDDEIATCKAMTGGNRSFSFAKLPSGTYYLTVNRAFDHPGCCLEGDILAFDEPIASDTSDCIRDTDPSVMDIVHGALDIAGFIPVLGAIPDGINAAIYVVEGDWTNAGLSAVAMVPAWGDGVKLGAIAGKSTIKISEKAAIKLGPEGIAKGLKDVKAASKAEKAALETTEEAAKAAKVEKEAVGEGTKLEKEAAERAKKEAAEKAEKEAAEKKKRGEKEVCATKYPLALACSMLPLFIFKSPQAALAALKISMGKSNLRLTSPNPSTGGPCAGVGMHYGVKDGGTYIASISCCPCCLDTPSGPKMVNRCRII